MEARIIAIKSINEPDGDLYVLERDSDIPFSVKRVFYIQNVPQGEKRGGHASRTSEFVYICLRGQAKVCIDSGKEKQTFLLEREDQALYLPRNTWMEFYEFSEDALILTLASAKYKKKDYFDDYEEFVRENSDETKENFGSKSINATDGRIF